MGYRRPGESSGWRSSETIDPASCAISPEASARRGVSIEELHTEFVSAPMSADPLFKVNALLAVPAGLSDAELKRELEALATEMMVDVELEPHSSGGAREPVDT